MIAKSDLIILAVSTTALAVGVYRWQTNARVPTVAVAPPPVERVVERTPESDDGAAAAGADTDPLVGNVPPEEPVVVRRVADAPASTGAGDEPAAPDVVVTAAPGRVDAAPAPSPTSSPAPSSLPASSGTGGGEPLYGRHVIENGEYLGLLAERFGTSVATLQSINELDGTTILVGDELLYPLPAN